ncbi:MAG: virion protein [Siphoviridae sp. ctvD11]|nr:MAG: virion protein [Siphoviridae sp. ctvD11]
MHIYKNRVTLIQLIFALGLILSFIVLATNQLPPWTLGTAARLDLLRELRDSLGEEMDSLKRSQSIEDSLRACETQPLNSLIDCTSAAPLKKLKQEYDSTVHLSQPIPPAEDQFTDTGNIVEVKLDPDLLALMIAIAKHEGWDNPKNLVRRYNNPGAMMAVDYCEYQDTGYHRFMIFETEEDGWNCLEKALIRYRDKGATISSLIHRWAPASDRNNPGRYSALVAKQLGVPASTKLSDLF